LENIWSFKPCAKKIHKVELHLGFMNFFSLAFPHISHSPWECVQTLLCQGFIVDPFFCFGPRLRMGKKSYTWQKHCALLILSKPIKSHALNMHFNKNVFNYNEKNSASNKKQNVNKNLTFTIPPISFVSFGILKQ
jgi:hypothetical protein